MKEVPHWELEVPNLFRSRHQFFKIGRKFLGKKSDLLSLKKASMTCHPMEQCHSPKKILGPCCSPHFDLWIWRLQKNSSFNLVFILFQTETESETDLLFWKIYSLAENTLAENQTSVCTMTRIPNFCPKTKRLFCLSIF